MMLSLGMFGFSLDTLAYSELKRRTSWRFASTSRVGVRDAQQFLGPGDDTISLDGWIAPEFAGDPTSLDTLRDMADGGEAWPLIDGTGAVHGAFVIDSIDTKAEFFFADGSPRRIEFTIELKAVDA
ncbi:MAG: phage tail protein [Sphingomonadaceae bacterium]|nr:phage tail protein [Sphingomonadaceae bacterium]